MKGGDRRRRKGSVYLLLSFIVPLFLYLSLSQCRSLPQSLLASWDSGIDSHRRLTAAKKTTKNNNCHNRHRHYISGHHKDRYLPEWYSSPVPVTSANCISRCSCFVYGASSVMIWSVIVVDGAVLQLTYTYKNNPPHEANFLCVITPTDINEFDFNYVLGVACKQTASVSSLPVRQVPGGPLSQEAHSKIEQDRNDWESDICYDILYCNILWGMQFWVDYLQIVVCYWLQISWWKL